MTFSTTDTLDTHGIMNETGWAALESPDALEALMRLAKGQTLFLHKLAQEPEERLAHYAEARQFYTVGKSGIAILFDGETMMAREGREPERKCIALGPCGETGTNAAVGYFAFQRRPNSAPGEFMIIRLTR